MEKHIGFITFTNKFHLEKMTIVNENRRIQHENVSFCFFVYIII